MGGKAFAIVGMRGSGKSTVLKSKLKLVNPDALLIYDPQAEYLDLYNHPLIPFDEFTNKCTNVSNAIIAIEEATIFLSNRGSNSDVRDFLVSARHRNNTFFLVYHSLRSIPRYVFDLIDYIILLKTNDTAEDVQTKFRHSGITNSFNKISSENWIPNNSQNGRHSPHVNISIY